MRFPIPATYVCAIIGVCLAQVLNAAQASESRRSDSISADVDEYVTQFMKRHHIPGVSVAVVSDGMIALTKSYGLANVEHRVPVTEHTVYQIASVTKTFTASAIMQLVKDGALGLDDKITERLPDLPRTWESVTVRHLLNHTSGIKNYTSVQGYNKTLRQDCTPREILDRVATAPLDFTPGAKWLYTNTGYVLLGMLIEQTTGKPYGESMAERVFKPLGMTHTRVNDLRVVITSRAQGYQWDGKTLRNAEYVSPTQPFAAGMLVSTLGDLVKWEFALAGHTILDESTLEHMWAPTRLNDGKEADYGFGWEVSKVNDHRRISHGGAIPGFSTEISRFIDDKLTVIVLTNADGGRADGLARGIAGLYLPALAAKPVEPIADNDKQTTERLRGMFEGALKGEVDGAIFTDQAKTKIIPAIKADQERLASFGALQTFQLLERKEQDQGLRVQYRAVLENMTVKLTFDLDKKGRIHGAGMQIED
ncbi:CubicO group peptidase, beta-lactamase class C family [Singulisphaera sp. GP187]|uniref:serine hydrolase domain-containing protein n=1 Tax=Singulisphaera sp. GP187 TaxID=1882752 RepID=UPI0009276BD6|nr:serine hydrolase domain-containing protein [Singulisphaera sp. GP187]SIO65040.1 CubicO group peptidase, beta-lactamase class C family [Singulisphaera sp. GP187]